METVDLTPVRLCLMGEEDVLYWMDAGEAAMLAQTCHPNASLEIHGKDQDGEPLPVRRVAVFRSMVKLDTGPMWRSGIRYAKIELVITGKALD